MTIALPPAGAEYTTPTGTVLVDAFAAHAVMIDTLDPNAPAVPGVQLQISGTVLGTPPNAAVNILLLMDFNAAHDILHGIENSLVLLQNLRHNQERQ